MKQTNDLREVSGIVKLPVYSAKAQGNPRILVKDYTDEYDVNNDEDLLILIQKKYIRTIEWHKYKIKTTFVFIYGKPLKVRQDISEVIIKIKHMIQNTGVNNIEEMITTIRNYLGYKCSFYRLEGERKIPINSDRITKAYQLISAKESFINIENVLYF